MISETTFILSKNRNYKFLTQDESAELNVSICVSYENKRSDNEGTQWVSYHAHSNYEMHIVLDGECEIELDSGVKYTISKNRFIIIPYGQKHRINRESRDFSKVLTHFSIRYIDEATSDFYKAFEDAVSDIKVFDVSEDIMYLINKLIENAKQKKHEYKSLIHSYLNAYIVEVARFVVGDNFVRKNVEFNDSRVSRAVEFIKANVANRITSNDVADHCFISSKQLGRLFEKYIGSTPSEYIRRSKIDFACRLLLETDISIPEITEQLGFSEVTAFINFFKRYEDITPARFRKSGGRDR